MLRRSSGRSVLVLGLGKRQRILKLPAAPGFDPPLMRYPTLPVWPLVLMLLRSRHSRPSRVNGCGPLRGSPGPCCK